MGSIEVERSRATVREDEEQRHSIAICLPIVPMRVRLAVPVSGEEFWRRPRIHLGLQTSPREALAR